MTASQSTITDVKIAFEHKTNLDYASQLSGEWIYFVDPETMDEVKAIYKNSIENTSLYGVFCKILKIN
jgi:hypothetical protein